VAIIIIHAQTCRRIADQSDSAYCLNLMVHADVYRPIILPVNPVRQCKSRPGSMTVAYRLLRMHMHEHNGVYRLLCSDWSAFTPNEL